MPEPIIIVQYDIRWPALFEEEKSRILGSVGDKIVAVGHIGSTAVPGLDAKPIIDMLAAVESMSDSLECIEPLSKLGYEYHFWPEYPERCLFLDGSMGAASHHLHMTEFESDFWQDKILFRDFLRAHPEVAREYGQLKKELAAEHGADREKYEDYTAAKSGFIESVLTSARTEPRPRST